MRHDGQVIELFTPRNKLEARIGKPFQLFICDPDFLRKNSASPFLAYPFGQSSQGEKHFPLARFKSKFSIEILCGKLNKSCTIQPALLDFLPASLALNELTCLINLHAALSEKLDEDHHAFEALVVLLVNILIGYECDCVHIASRLKLPIESSPNVQTSSFFNLSRTDSGKPFGQRLSVRSTLAFET